MQTLEWKFEDTRQRWLPETRDRSGPWDNEPDKRQWTDVTTGLPCLIVRNHYGNLCGYVGVPKGHPWHGKDYDDVNEALYVDDDAEEVPHGALTFAGLCSKNPEGKICHVVEPGDPDDVWWLGFDCGHAFDFVPGLHWLEGTYRNMAYVTAECEKLAALAVKAA
jgi:hypothetical protein